MYEANYDHKTTIDFKDLLRILQKRRAVILGLFLISIFALSLVSFLRPRIYQAETTLRVKQARGLSDSLLSELPLGNPLATKQEMSTYAEIIKSRTVINEVIKSIRSGRQKPLTYDSLINRIIISPVRDTEILKLQARAASPAEARVLADTVVHVFIKRLSELAHSEQTVIREFLSERLEGAKIELAQAERKLEAYKIHQKIMAPDEETKALVAQMLNYNKLLAENQIELATGQARLALANQQLENEKPGFVADNQFIQQCKSKLVDLEVELVGLLENYTTSHPQVVAVQARIDEVKQQLGAEITRVVNVEAASQNPIHQGLLENKLKAEAELTATLAQKNALDAIVAREETVLTKLPVKERGLARVMRDALLAQEIYIMLAKRYEEARITEAMQPTNVQVVDSANLPQRPIAPNHKKDIVTGAFLGLATGIGLALLLEYFNKTIVTAEDVERYLDLPVLGNIPVFNAKSCQNDGHPGLWERRVLKRKV